MKLIYGGTEQNQTKLCAVNEVDGIAMVNLHEYSFDGL